MQIRTMTEKDIPAGTRLKDIAGWNQTEADWRIFLNAGRDGCFVAEVDDVVRGTAATIDSIQVPCIKLDATPLGKPIYEGLGFASEYELERWTLKRRREDLPRQGQTDPDEFMPAPLLENVLKADREVFGADRSAVLRAVNRAAPRFTDSVWNAGGMEGYAFGRRGSFADHLGPWIAKDEATGHRILDRFLAQSSREVVLTDCSNANPFIKRILQARGFEYSRPLARMFRGRNEYPGQPELVCAILGPEFG